MNALKDFWISHGMTLDALSWECGASSKKCLNAGMNPERTIIVRELYETGV
jgi:hypothetical protein